MQFSNKKKALAAGMIAVGGLALVGVGTGAAFTDTVTANSTFKAGTADLDITTAANYTISDDKNTATLNAERLFYTSTFTDVDDFMVTNNGDIKVPLKITVNKTGQLADKMYVSATTALPVVGGEQWLAPGDSARISVYIENAAGDLTNADSGKTASVSINVSGSI